jgi:hypothetical protein
VSGIITIISVKFPPVEQIHRSVSRISKIRNALTESE